MMVAAFTEGAGGAAAALNRDEESFGNHFITRRIAMPEKSGHSNVGKKEQRQYDQILDKAVKEDRYEAGGQPKEVEARTVPEQHAKKKGGK